MEISTASARRTYDFEKEIEKFRTVLNAQRIVLLELEAYSKNTAKVSDRDVKKGFVDCRDDGGVRRLVGHATS